MRPPPPPPPPADDAYAAELGRLAEHGGIARWGVAPAGVLVRARQALHQRRGAGLHDTMQFTYRNPDRSTDPQRAVPGAAAIFVAAMPYQVEPPTHRGADDAGAHASPLLGRIARYAWADSYGRLRAALDPVVRRLRADGWRALLLADDNSLVDREVAHLAGLGWYGKNANLLVAGMGSWFVLGSVVTTAPLPATAGPVADGCGGCVRCIERCPTGAIVAPGVIDAGRCLSWLLQRPGPIATEFRVALGDRLYGCDDCQEACPPTVRDGRRRAAADDRVTTSLDLVELLESDDQVVLDRWGRWYLAERDPRWVRRNALVALGNVLAEGVPAPARSRAMTILQRYRDGADELLAEHAAWAASRAAAGSPATEQ